MAAKVVVAAATMAVVVAVATVVVGSCATVVVVVAAVVGAENEWRARHTVSTHQSDPNLFCIVNQLLRLSNHSFKIYKTRANFKQQNKINLLTSKSY